MSGAKIIQAFVGFTCQNKFFIVGTVCANGVAADAMGASDKQGNNK